MKLFEVNQTQLSEFILTFESEESNKVKDQLSSYWIDHDYTSDSSEWGNDQSTPEKIWR